MNAELNRVRRFSENNIVFLCSNLFVIHFLAIFSSHYRSCFTIPPRCDVNLDPSSPFRCLYRNWMVVLRYNLPTLSHSSSQDPWPKACRPHFVVRILLRRDPARQVCSEDPRTTQRIWYVHHYPSRTTSSDPLPGQDQSFALRPGRSTSTMWSSWTRSTPHQPASATSMSFSFGLYRCPCR